jgi:N-acetylmuramoyl-L-alanine amidase
LWDLAQLRHLERSAELAAILEAQLRDRIPLAPLAINRLPLAVLESANMPAVLVEMGYLTNPNQATALAGPAFQNAFVQAVYDAVVKFRDATRTEGTR